MKMRWLATVLRNHSVPALIAETAWRSVRSLRRKNFQPNLNSACPVRFAPIGYYPSLGDENREAVIAYADAVLRGDYPLLGYSSPHLGAAPDWQRDWVSGKDWPLQQSAKLRIIRNDGSDVKAPWELSRLQWGPVVAKAWRLTGEPKYRDALQSLLSDWANRNPVMQGVNWTVAMEAALRGISLCLTMELLWPFTEKEQAWVDQMTRLLWQHLRFIEAYCEFSLLTRSNHYLSNIVGLATLSAYLQGPGMERRFQKSAAAAQEEIFVQTYPDGGDREASTGYHLLVAQMFLHSLIVQRAKAAKISPAFEARLRSMFEWMALLADDNWQLPVLGDCDNGRVELLPEDIAQAGLTPCQRHALRVRSLCRQGATLLGAPLPQGLPSTVLCDSGLGVLRKDEASVVFCAMPNGLGGKGSHTHCDKLAIVFRLAGVEVFTDSGSRCYTRSAAMRNADRSTTAHTTLLLESADQNLVNQDPGSLFISGNQAVVSPISASRNQMWASHQGYKRFGVEHRRKVELDERSLLLIDELNGTGNHRVELRFILGPEWQISSEMMGGKVVRCQIMGPRRLSLSCESGTPLELTVQPTEISREYGASLPASSISIKAGAAMPAKFETRVVWN
jgi:hypothetical protein